MVIAIDGPAGSGKSTIAKAIAKKLDFYFLNTGSFYRAYTLAQLNAKKDPMDKDSVLTTAEGVKITVEKGDICINGVDVESQLHT
ncbi:MAG: (d)CMP kinase, partial [Spirochaetales bacterium]|nr:(d)CMP kinase [Candidatus Physcosoma equi]